MPHPFPFSARPVPQLASTLTLAATLLLSGCWNKHATDNGYDPDDIVPLLPKIKDRQLWAQDIHDALVELKLPRSLDNVCAVVAVIGQESNFQADPPVAGVSRILKTKIDKLQENFLMRAALNVRLDQKMSDGRRTFREGMAQLRTERDVELWYRDFTTSSLTQPVLKLLGKSVDDLITTSGSMQVSVDYARQIANEFGKDAGNIRRDIYERKWGIFYGTAHLLYYDAPYKQMKFRFADYNAGHYASRNAAFQYALGQLAKQPISQDGDLLIYRNNDGRLSESQQLARQLAQRYKLELTGRDIDHDLGKEKERSFEETQTYKQFMSLYQAKLGKEPAYARLPEIHLKSDKISRDLTTGWFAERVNSRFNTCKSRDR